MNKISLLLVVLITTFSCGSKSEQPKDQIYNVEGIALDGYDPVAYFIQGEPKRGLVDEKVDYQGVTYLFSSTKNRLLFLEEPQRYLPKYGGWCAYAVAETSSKMEPDPTMWQVQNGELQLFYDDWMTSLTGSLKKEWNTNPTDYKKKADINWGEMGE